LAYEKKGGKSLIFKTITSILFILAMMLSFITKAHEVRPSYLELTQNSSDSYQVMWKVPAKGQLRLALYIDFDNDIEVISPTIEYFSSGSYISKWQIRHARALVGTEITIDGLHATFTEVLVRIEHLDGSVQVARLMPEKPSVLVEASPSTFDIISTYTGLGIKHIWMGIDHLLFLICLLLIASTGKRIFITITGFTLAHSVTLALSALNFVTLSIAPVEAIIALSIVFLATEIAKGKRETYTWKYPVTVSSTFGLLHGFGFATVLNEIGLPQTEVVTGLLFFNIGVEIGQLAFIMTILMFLKLGDLLGINFKQALLAKPTAYVIGTLASFWLIERSASFLFII